MDKPSNAELYELILMKGCREYGLDYEEAVRYFFMQKDKEYNIEDIKTECVNGWYTDEEQEAIDNFDDGDYECIQEWYRDNFDGNKTFWGGIHDAITDYIRGY